MSILQAIVLGIVQGITEFLPISSTGHLRLVPRLMHWPDAGMAFDAALHAGTLLAIVSYFWRDWIDMLKPVLAPRKYAKSADSSPFGKNLFWGIVVACIPAGIATVLVKDTIDAMEQSKNPAVSQSVMIIVAIALIAVAIVMFAAEKYGSKKKTKLSAMGFADWIVIGLAQAVALIPGVSRSGSTITAGLFRGLDRDTAARFSFLLSTPIFAAGALFALKDIKDAGLSAADKAPFLVGMITSAIVGYMAIRFLLSYIKKHSVNVFVWYRIALGVSILTLILAKIY